MCKLKLLIKGGKYQQKKNTKAILGSIFDVFILPYVCFIISFQNSEFHQKTCIFSTQYYVMTLKYTWGDKKYIEVSRILKL